MDQDNSITSVDTGADTEAARAYKRKQERLQRLIVNGPTEKDDSASNQITPSATSPTVCSSNQDMSVYTVTFAPTKATVELSFTATAPAATFAIQVKPLTLTETDDSISIMLPADITVKPPKLTPFQLKVDGRPYTVVFAGGVLKTEKASVISFLRVSNDGEESNS